jgi:2-C-methyl-D-erythritol 4-phosphate cytidylyltransferase
MSADAKATALIAAAGSGERLGAGAPKALVALAGRPMVVWSVEAMVAAKTIVQVIVTAPPGSEPEMRSATMLGSAAPVRMITGGASRSASVRAALELVETEFVAVHDAARPLIEPLTVDAAVAALVADPAAAGLVVAAPVADTLKRGDGGRVEQTVSRDGLWAIQTPQVFRTEALRSALDVDEAVLAAATDDAGLVERAGGSVLIHASDELNPKVTTKADLEMVELVLQARAAASAPQ